MKITILTLFPDMFTGFTGQSIIKRALAKNLVEVAIVNIRDFTLDKYGRVDTPPIGGGAGLVMKAQPLHDAIKSTKTSNTHTILLSPRGSPFCQDDAVRLSKMEHIQLVCGHYEGIDERINEYVSETLSLGDFVLTGGEIAAMAMADAVIRLLPDVIEKESLFEESFTTQLLEYPQYTEPSDYMGHKVPDILYCGNHEAIAKWRQLMRLIITREKRPDLFAKYTLSRADQRLLHDHDNRITPKWLSSALEKGKRFIKSK